MLVSYEMRLSPKNVSTQNAVIKKQIDIYVVQLKNRLFSEFKLNINTGV